MAESATKKMAIAIDGNSLCYRAYYATAKSMEKYLTQQNANPVNAVKLMLIMCLKLLRKNQYEFSIVAFDTPKPTFRKLAHPEYKGKRKKMPTSLVTQLPLIVESLRYIGFNVATADGWEADDLVGSFVQLMSQKNIYTNIYSSDYDLLQLVSEKSSLFMPIKGVSEMREYNWENFPELFYGLTPDQVPHLKAIAGDASDNYSGVKGIGKKTAIDLLKKYKDLDGIFENSLKLTKRQYQLFASQLSTLKLCLNLSVIKQNYFAGIDDISPFALRSINTASIKEFTKKYFINGLDKYL